MAAGVKGGQYATVVVQVVDALLLRATFVNQSASAFWSLGTCLKYIGHLMRPLLFKISCTAVYRSPTEGRAFLLQKLMMSWESPYTIKASAPSQQA